MMILSAEQSAGAAGTPDRGTRKAVLIRQGAGDRSRDRAEAALQAAVRKKHGKAEGGSPTGIPTIGWIY